MTDLASYWREFLAVALPFAMSVLLQSKWSDRTKRLCLVAVAAAVAAGDAYFGGTLNLADPARTFFTVFLGSQGTFHLLQRQIKTLTEATDLDDPEPPIYRYDIRHPDTPQRTLTVTKKTIT